MGDDRKNKINGLKKEIEELENEQHIEENMPENHRLADLIHDKLCRANHIDQCGYEYESWENPGSTRKEYLEKADAILKITDFKTAESIIELL